jgi:hypothetical protein
MERIYSVAKLNQFIVNFWLLEELKVEPYPKSIVLPRALSEALSGISSFIDFSQ